MKHEKTAIKIVVVGSINCDIVNQVKNFPAPNETIFSHDYTIAIGGKGLNQAIAAARQSSTDLPITVHMIGCVGDDDFGRQALAHLKENGVNTDGVLITDQAPTGMASIFVDDAANNMIAVASGANMALSADHVSAHQNLIVSADLIITQAEVSTPVLSAALKISKQANIPSIFNPAPADKNHIDLIANARYVTPNESETQILTGIWPETDDGLKLALRALLKDSDTTPLITCGSRGAVYEKDGELQWVKPFAVQAVDTTGAGDVYNGVFAVGIASDLAIGEAAHRASVAAAISVTRPTANSAPSFDELQQFLQENKANG